MTINPVVELLSKQMSNNIVMLNDLIIKKIWGTPNNSEKRLIDFLNAFRSQFNEPPIEHVDISDPTNHPDKFDDKMTFVDIKARDSQKNWYNIEVQYCEHPNFISRIIYYGAKIHSSQLTKGRSFTQLRKTVCIVFTNFSLFKDTSQLFHTFELLSIDPSHRVLGHDLQFNFIEMPKIDTMSTDNNTFNPQLADWMKFLNFPHTSPDEMTAIVNRNSSIADAAEDVADFISDYQDVLEEREKIRRVNFAVYEQSVINAREEGLILGREEGIVLGLNKGLVQGREEGIAKGLVQGREEGIAQGREEGIAQGREEGIAQGSIDRQVQLVQKYVTRQFQTVLPESYIDKIRTWDSDKADDFIFQLHELTSLEQVELLINKYSQE